ncbi:MAG: hypothetical protein AVDCRST_MAG03-454, partial [uncultured Rubrobacteraceae bacterium]
GRRWRRRPRRDDHRQQVRAAAPAGSDRSGAGGRRWAGGDRLRLPGDRRLPVRRDGAESNEAGGDGRGEGARETGSVDVHV